MKKGFFTLLVMSAIVGAATALDIDYTLSAGVGPAMAFAGTVKGDLADTESSLNYSGVIAPVLGAAFGLGADFLIGGGFSVSSEIEARRLGYARWAPTSGAYSWLAAWSMGLHLGLRYRATPWYTGLGAQATFLVNDISQSRSAGGATIDQSNDHDEGRVRIPGAYLEGGMAIASPFSLGPVRFTPRLGLEAGLWPAGMLDGAWTWQTALTALISLDMEVRRSR